MQDCVVDAAIDDSAAENRMGKTQMKTKYHVWIML